MDYFELLGIPRRASLDREELKARFLELGKASHPDAPGGGDAGNFSDLNRAHQTLASVPGRLKHLLELEFDSARDAGPAGGAMEDSLLEVFAELGALLPGAMETGRRLSLARSALSKALLADEVFRRREELEAIGNTIGTMLDARRGCLELIDRTEGDARRALLGKAYAEFGFLERWQAQVRESLLGLTV